MPFIKTDFPDLMIFEPEVHGDDRGYFFESYNQKIFSQESSITFIQDNQARSVYGVVRGLHYQNNPYAQTKLIRALHGTVLDVAVDLRINSPAYGKAFTIELSAQNRKQLLVPQGFAHGYAVLTESAEVFYKVDNYYSREHEGGLAYNDPSLIIDWKIPFNKMILSQKDLHQPCISNCNHNFIFTS